METREAGSEAGTLVEIAGGKMLRVEDAGAPAGTTIAIRDLFFNTPARRKFLRAEQTELAHVAALVTHYALAHPAKHFELHSATQALLTAPAVANVGERIYQIFGREVSELLIPVAAEVDLRGRTAGASTVEAGRGIRSAGAGVSAAERIRVEAGVAEAEPEFDLRVCEWQADPRQADPACVERGVPEHPSADFFSCRAPVPGDAGAGGRCECASGEDGGAVPAAELCA